jgi:hypothetical protein
MNRSASLYRVQQSKEILLMAGQFSINFSLTLMTIISLLASTFCCLSEKVKVHRLLSSNLFVLAACQVNLPSDQMFSTLHSFDRHRVAFLKTRYKLPLRQNAHTLSGVCLTFYKINIVQFLRGWTGRSIKLDTVLPWHQYVEYKFISSFPYIFKKWGFIKRALYLYLTPGMTVTIICRNRPRPVPSERLHLTIACIWCKVTP